MQTIPIPHVDPLPLPGPVWLFTALLLVVFTLHLLAMNSALGGGIWALWNYLRGRHADHAYSRRLANELAALLPTFLAFTVTLGVAALLFVQVLYGNYLYTSSILIGALWLSVIPLVILAYYGLYVFSFQAEKGKGIAGCVLAVSVCLLLGIAFIFVNNMTLMQRPESWLGMYRAHPNGWNLNLGDHSVIPRYLHMVNGAMVVFSAILVEIGLVRIKSDADYGKWLVQRAGVVFAACTGLQFLFGFWLLVAIPRDIAFSLLRDPLSGGVFGLALMSAIAALHPDSGGEHGAAARSDGARRLRVDHAHAVPHGVPALPAAGGLPEAIRQPGCANGASADRRHRDFPAAVCGRISHRGLHAGPGGQRWKNGRQRRAATLIQKSARKAKRAACGPPGFYAEYTSRRADGRIFLRRHIDSLCPEDAYLCGRLNNNSAPGAPCRSCRVKT